MEMVQPGEGHRGAIEGVLFGVGASWIVTPLVVVFAALGRGTEGVSWVLPALVAIALTGGTGYLLGRQSLGWAGLVGAFVGAIAEMALPYLLVPRLLGLPIWGVDVYGEYMPGAVVAAVAATLGLAIGARSRAARRIRASWVVGGGVCVFAVWFGVWLVMGRSIGVAT